MRGSRARRFWRWMRCRFIAGRISGRASRRRRSGRRFRMAGWIWSEFGESFDVAQYLEHAAAFLREQREAGRRVIVVGGTGLYFRALTRGLVRGAAGSGGIAGGVGDAFGGGVARAAGEGRSGDAGADRCGESAAAGAGDRGDGGDGAVVARRGRRRRRSRW